MLSSMMGKDNNNNNNKNAPTNSSNYSTLFSFGSKSLPPDEKELGSKIEFTITIKREQIIISKTPYMKDKIVIKKKQVKETITIKEELVHEDIIYDSSRISGMTKDYTSLSV